MGAIELDQVSKVYPDGTAAVSDVDLSVADGQLAVLVGPSGCGKTTLLRMVAGLEQITEGSVRIGGRVVNHVPAKERDIAMVFQNYALYPHMSVYDNMGFGLKLRKVKGSEIDRSVRQAADLLALTEQLQKRPRHISGGQRQRVAMGRAIVREPQAFLMDEPLSNLDAKLRVYMRTEIRELQRSLGVTTIYVTHDQTEAMTLGDVVAVMRRGRVEQLDPPHDLYGRPRSVFVAGFIGSPAMNLAEVTLEEQEGALFVRLGESRLRISETRVDERPGIVRYAGRRVIIGIRPEHMSDAELGPASSDADCMSATCELREEVGSDVYLHFRLPVAPVVTDDIQELSDEIGIQPVRGLADSAAAGSRFIARVSTETEAREGLVARIRLDTRWLHFFDPASGEGIYA
jgi:multiple sugar transport system ATP-binding protein